jgi:TPR repeat protein
MYAKLLLVGNLIPADRNEAIKWLTKAADKGYADAIEILPKARDPRVVIGFKP